MTIIQADVEITHETLAEVFWSMDSDDQALFFDGLADIIQKSKGPNCWGEAQWLYLKESLKKPGMERANKMFMAFSAFAFEHVEQKQL